MTPIKKKSYICFCSVNGRARNLYIFQKMNHGIYVELALFSLLMIIVQVVWGCFPYFFVKENVSS